MQIADIIYFSALEKAVIKNTNEPHVKRACLPVRKAPGLMDWFIK